MLQAGDNVMSVKRSNRKAALYRLREQGGMSRKMLAQSMELTPAAMTKIVGEMIEENLLLEGTTLRSSVGAGRSQVLIELNTKAYCGLGVMINVRQAILSAVWLDGSVIFSECIPLEKQAAALPTVEMLSARLIELSKAHDLASERVIGIGVAIRGVTDLKNRLVLDSYGALQEKNYPLAEMFEKCTGFDVVMNNNVRALFAAQMFQSRDKLSLSQFFLRCEYGIGASLSIRDDIWTGGNGRCSEIGHIPVVRRGGKPCLCGKSGCLETIASPAAIQEEAMAICSPKRTPLLWRIRETKGAQLDLNAILDAARNGDAGVAYVVDRAVKALGAALKNVIYTIDPQKIVLYGGLFENTYYLSRLMAEMSQGIDDDHRDVIIEKSQFNNLLEPMAAGILTVDRFFNNGGMK